MSLSEKVACAVCGCTSANIGGWCYRDPSHGQIKAGEPTVFAVKRDIDNRVVVLFRSYDGAKEWMAQNNRSDSTYASHFIDIVPVLP